MVGCTSQRGGREFCEPSPECAICSQLARELSVAVKKSPLVTDLRHSAAYRHVTADSPRSL